MKIFKSILNMLGKREQIKYARSIGVEVGDNCRFVSTSTFGSEPWLIKIGNHVNLSQVTFITHDGATWCFRDIPKYEYVIKYGKIEIKDNCFIGHGAIIMPGVTIGPNAAVGAGSIVTKDVRANTIVAGNPARYICNMEEYAEKCLTSTPDYDVELYRENKQKCVLQILGQ